MDELLKALKLLLGHSNREEVVTLIEKEGAPVFQAIFQKGHDIGYGKKHGELDKANARVTELEASFNATKTELDKLKANPDTKALHEQYGAQIADLTAKAAARERELQDTLIQEVKTQRLGALRTALTTGDKRLVPEYADVLIEKAEHAARVRVNADRSWTVLQKGKDIPIAAQTPEAALVLMAEELKAEAPPLMILVGTDTGGGTTSGAPRAGSSGATGAAALAQSIRDSVQKSVTPGKESPKPHGPFAALAAEPQ